MMLWPWTPGARRRKDCFHHDRAGWNKPGEATSISYVSEHLIDMGRNKRYICEPSRGGCGQQWFIW